ncbi:MAG: NAD-dependent epimerase/dehydratase family protein [Candidatus Omnitrophica bacterium]|nr:NAD-dependent epimerase/dehydratase family protein [Candidatus Omnitrophota bacterium]
MKYEFTGKTIAVTGGTGFIGSYLVSELVSMGNNVRLLVRDVHAIPSGIKALPVEYVQGDIRDVLSLKKLLHNADVVYHLAGKMRASKKVVDDELYDINTRGTQCVLDACVAENVPQFIYFSSVAVMKGTMEMADESSICEPHSEYGESKLAAERLVSEYHEKYNIRTTILRLVVVYGIGDKGNMMKLIEAVRTKRFVLIDRGRTVRSVVYVRNVINAALCVTLAPRADGNVYIVTDGECKSLREIAHVVAQHFRVSLYPFSIPVPFATLLAEICELIQPIAPFTLPLNRNILRRLLGNQRCSSKCIQDDLGFTPISFEQGMAEVIDELRNKT